jgi:hypothetical protein
VLPQFTALNIDYVPRRWADHNVQLGSWLYQLRDRLRPGTQITFDANLPQGVTFAAASQRGFELRNAVFQPRPDGESVVIIAPPDRSSTRSLAARLNGVYGVMEDIGGRFMTEALGELQLAEPLGYAKWLAQVAKNCFVGYSRIDQTVLRRLERGQSVTALTRPGFQRTLAALDRVLGDPTYEVMASAMREIRAAKEAQLHSREAWNDMALALDRCGADSDRTPAVELGTIGDRVRHAGRPDHRRVISRTALIKGLEYDHVIIADVGRITDHCNLYVALSRARKSVTIIGRNATITVTETKRSPAAPSRPTARS